MRTVVVLSIIVRPKLLLVLMAFSIDDIIIKANTLSSEALVVLSISDQEIM